MHVKLNDRDPISIERAYAMRVQRGCSCTRITLHLDPIYAERWQPDPLAPSEHYELSRAAIVQIVVQ
jgi:hypothetical protein